MLSITIANHLNIAQDLILNIDEWATVFCVKIKGIGQRFVSKKALKLADESTLLAIEEPNINKLAQSVLSICSELYPTDINLVQGVLKTVDQEFWSTNKDVSELALMLYFRFKAGIPLSEKENRVFDYNYQQTITSSCGEYSFEDSIVEQVIPVRVDNKLILEHLFIGVDSEENTCQLMTSKDLTDQYYPIQYQFSSRCPQDWKSKSIVFAVGHYYQGLFSLELICQSN